MGSLLLCRKHPLHHVQGHCGAQQALKHNFGAPRSMDSIESCHAEKQPGRSAVHTVPYDGLGERTSCCASASHPVISPTLISRWG